MSADAKADLAVIVLSVGAPPHLAEAVRSVASQSEPAEILVVNSGGGDAAAVLARAGLHVSVLDVPELLLPGAARNAGIAATRAPYVAFLAADCLAAPGWVANRLAAHRAGRRAVASALVNDQPRNPIAWAAHVAVFDSRLPGTPRRAALRYGASYDRTLFDEFGTFDPTLRIGEDTLFHRRIGRAHRPAWAPKVRTIHRNPGTLAAFLGDQFRRGRRRGGTRELNGATRLQLACRVLGNTLRKMRYGWIGARKRDRLFLALGMPLIPVGNLVLALGILIGPPKLSQGPGATSQHLPAARH
ncbi:glycosyltransferase family 2 protein [Dongia deserti]|uniref:glycosyltransferase family 2 protein n=1 Tax=Dongia deserti TaxID=2268030 RepID=UPI0013C4CA42|nr:glycosyltransferase family A protein [Dongia deserti]